MKLLMGVLEREENRKLFMNILRKIWILAELKTYFEFCPLKPETYMRSVGVTGIPDI